MIRRMLLLVLTVVIAPALGHAADSTSTAAGMRTLYLIRHGDYDHRDSADARVGKHLNALGREQAALVGARIKAFPVAITSIRTSTLTRAMETGDIIGSVLGMTVMRDSLFNECTPPTSRADIKHDTPGEADSAQAQLEAAWAAYARPSPAGPAHDVIAAHGNVIRWFLTKAIGADTKQWAQMEIANGSISIITIKPDGAVRLVGYNDFSHLPVAKQTWAGRGPGWVVPGGSR